MHIYVYRDKDINYKIRKTKACTAYCKSNCIRQIKHKKLVSYSLSLSFGNQIHRSNSSVHNINWYTLQCCFDSSWKFLKIFTFALHLQGILVHLFLTIWKIFSIGFRPGLNAGIENFCHPILSQADLAF